MTTSSTPDDPVPAPVLDLGSWAEFTHYVDDIKDVGSPTQVAYLFRGHADQSWRLRPSLLREFERNQVTAERAIEIERIALREFKRQAHLYIRDELLAATDNLLAWWTLMQHHGAPTRLIDWTSSPYVAAYFTVRSHLAVPGVIWVFHVATVEMRMKAAYSVDFLSTDDDEQWAAACQNPTAPSALVFIRRPRETERMIVQQGHFTVSPQILTDHGAAIAGAQGPVTEEEPPQFFGMRVSPEMKLEFLRRLKYMNVTARALFPGVDGLGQSVAGSVALEVDHKETE